MAITIKDACGRTEPVAFVHDSDAIDYMIREMDFTNDDVDFVLDHLADKTSVGFGEWEFLAA